MRGLCGGNDFTFNAFLNFRVSEEIVESGSNRKNEIILTVAVRSACRFLTKDHALHCTRCTELEKGYLFLSIWYNSL